MLGWRLKLLALSTVLALGLATPQAMAFDAAAVAGLKAKPVCKGCDLSGAPMEDMYLPGAILTNADLSGAHLKGANLSFSNLRGAKLAGADLSGVTFENANLSGDDLSNDNITKTNLHGADFSGTVPEFADAAF